MADKHKQAVSGGAACEDEPQKELHCVRGSFSAPCAGPQPDEEMLGQNFTELPPPRRSPLIPLSPQPAIRPETAAQSGKDLSLTTFWAKHNHAHIHTHLQTHTYSTQTHKLRHVCWNILTNACTERALHVHLTEKNRQREGIRKKGGRRKRKKWEWQNEQENKGRITK